jgi:hypothetical protein
MTTEETVAQLQDRIESLESFVEELFDSVFDMEDEEQRDIKRDLRKSWTEHVKSYLK